MKNIKVVFVLIFMVSELLLGQGKIKKAVYWTAPTMTKSQAEILAKYDLLIVDFENAINNEIFLNLIKVINPEIKLLAYSNPFEIWDQTVIDRPLQGEWIKQIKEKYPDWLLKTATDQKVIFYPGMRLTNMTSTCPHYDVPGLGLINFNDWMSHLLLTKVLNNAVWDGYFMDNAGGNIAWINDLIDADLNRLPDKVRDLDYNHATGVSNFLKKIRETKGKSFILIGNKGSVEFMDVLDGRMFEFFPNNYLGDKSDFGFWQSLTNAKQTGKYTVILVKPTDIDFGYATVRLLGNDAYLAVGHNNPNYYEQYDYDLGDPQDDQIIIELKTTNGQIIIDPSRKKAKINYK